MFKRSVNPSFVERKIILSYLLLLMFISTAVNVVADEVAIVEASTAWYYCQNGSDQGTAWYGTDFMYNTDWEPDPADAPFGFGDNIYVTELDHNDDQITYYFRKQFVVTQEQYDQFPNLVLKLLRDDGAVVYLNGSEIERQNMPEGTINYNTYASIATQNDDEETFFPSLEDKSLLIIDDPNEPGDELNTIAVEVHLKHGTSDCSFNLELVLTDQFPPIMQKAPYLIYNGNYSEMEVHWQLEADDDETYTLRWGVDNNCLAGEATPSEWLDDIYFHAIPILESAHGTLHYYLLENSAEETVFESNFYPSPPDGAESFNFFVYGDTRNDGDDIGEHNNVAQAMVNIFDNDSSWQTVAISVGDLVQAGNHESHWNNYFFNPDFDSVQSLLSSMPYQSARGNHEFYSNHNDLTFYKYFPYPYEISENIPPGHPNEPEKSYYWSFDYGPAHFVVVDQYEIRVPIGVNDKIYQLSPDQMQWIENDLASTDKDWKFIVLHWPGWSAGGSHENNEFVQNFIQPLCLQYDVSMVFGGHNHYYARADVNGIKHITTGGGGAPLHVPDDTYENIEETAGENHYCQVEINSNDQLSFTAKNLDPEGQDYDSFPINKRESYTFDDDSVIRNIADFIVNLQYYDGYTINDPEYGAIPDFPDCPTINKDSTMEYALMGLAAAYQEYGDQEYLTALKAGIDWLASVQNTEAGWYDTDDETITQVEVVGDMIGSWFYSYRPDGRIHVRYDTGEASRIHQRISDSGRDETFNIYGVDTTSALFVYLVYLYYNFTGNIIYEDNANKALDFLFRESELVENNYYTYSSWEQENYGDEWDRIDVKYSADQADVYLGMKAGSILFPNYAVYDYTVAAENLKYACNSTTDQNIGFFKNDFNGVNCIDLYYTNLDGIGYSWGSTFSGSFAQGYLPWVFGNYENNLPNNQLAYNWITGDDSWTVYFDPNWSVINYYLRFEHLKSTGDYRFIDYSPIIQYTNPGDNGTPEDPIHGEIITDNTFSLNNILYHMAATSLGQTQDYYKTESVLNWLLSCGLYDHDDGGIYDCLTEIDNENTKYINVSGFAVMSLTQFPTTLEGLQPVMDITEDTEWVDPIDIANDITVHENVTLTISTDVNFLRKHKFIINGNVNITENGSLNLLGGTNVQVNEEGTLFLDWGSTITGATRTTYVGNIKIQGDQIICIDGGRITTRGMNEYYSGAPEITISSTSGELWDGIFIKNPSNSEDFWFVNCDISHIRKLAIENISDSQNIANLNLYLTNFHNAEQIVVRDGHILTMAGTADTPCLIQNSQSIKAYESPVNLTYVYAGGRESGNDKPIYLYGSAATNSTINNCNFSYNNCDGFLSNDVVISEFNNVTIANNTGFGMFCYDGTSFFEDAFTDVTICNNGYSEYAGSQNTFNMGNENANIIVTDDNFGVGSDNYLLIDVDWDEHNPVDISGTNIESINHLLPTDSNAWTLSTINGSAEILLETAEIDFANGNYANAQELLYELLDDYLDSPQAVNAVYYLFHIEVLTTEDYEELRDYLDTLAVEEGTKLYIVIEKVKAQSLIKDDEYLEAIDILENIIINCNLPDEVVAAMIDQGYAYLELAETEERSLPERCTVKTATLDEYQAKVDELLTQFSFYPDIEKIKENIVPVAGKILTHCNYPNPFNPVTTIAFNISSESDVSITIYNLKGQKVKKLLNEELSAGQHTIVWNGTDENNKSVASGIYFYKITTSKDSDLRKMLLLK